MAVGKKRRKLATLLILSALTSSCATFYACYGGLNIAVYMFREDGIFRKQSNTLIKFSDPKLSKEYLAMSFEDYKALREYCRIPAMVGDSVEPQPQNQGD
jgi:hypothetical protein